VWVGAGPLGRDDGKVMLFLRPTAALLRPAVPIGDRPDGPEHDRLLGREGLDLLGTASTTSSPLQIEEERLDHVLGHLAGG